ncbi:LysM peptidoglycan-binding domain-containing protein [uncultured Megasphaera sp.]|uniref:LysM peptidoglycan-binding domain-containing protein n=1 Tax=uncultured Megasphaera sp. TaxID=165188 RepID=UPI0025D98AAE|nr:LysM peptidoglycan-binding domain-containing protein [uncultured Megasphaera sp.]
MRKRRRARSPLFKYAALIGLAIFMCTQIGWSYQPSQEYVSVRVEQGQTIWQLASVVVDEDTDVRQVIQSILDENKLTGDKAIQPGQVLRLPVSAGKAGHVRQAFAGQLVP